MKDIMERRRVRVSETGHLFFFLFFFLLSFYDCELRCINRILAPRERWELFSFGSLSLRCRSVVTPQLLLYRTHKRRNRGREREGKKRREIGSIPAARRSVRTPTLEFVGVESFLGTGPESRDSGNTFSPHNSKIARKGRKKRRVYRSAFTCLRRRVN